MSHAVKSRGTANSLGQPPGAGPRGYWERRSGVPSCSGQGPGGQVKLLTREWPQTRLFLAQTLGLLTCKGLGVEEGLAPLSKLPLSWTEEGRQGPRSGHRRASPCACHRSVGTAGLLGLLVPSPIFKARGPKSSLGINGTCKREGEGGTC
ncbi:hypothetical protein HJG60_010048 [Phyllostomus discolor]|uniref:Uncharacterized protein n=1 Tax=Phyllostomus discolor TaxID=89673 RepID=A0A834ARX1_9CHIR|nr:hypothetical protein HJG60_010048 [Phyllostomus discolor]